ncbi:MAG: substrate-binding domain-containing protein [Bacillota bacterium]
MKKIFTVLLILVLAPGMFTACGGGAKEEALSDKPTKTIGFSQVNLNDPFQTLVVEAATVKADELGYTLDVQYAQEDLAKQIDQVNAMIEQGYDAIMVVPVDTSAMGPITDAVTAAGIPLIYVNRYPFGTEEPPAGVYYVGSQSIVSGRLQGQFLIDAMGEKGGVGILMGILVNEAAVERTKGNEEILFKYPDIKILAKEAGDWAFDKGMDITENWLATYGKALNAILSNNDNMALGALQALEDAGRDDVIVVGIDAITDARELVKEGKLAATVLQDAAGQGVTGVEVAVKAAGGEIPEAVTWIDYILITPENVDQYL